MSNTNPRNINNVPVIPMSERIPELEWARLWLATDASLQDEELRRIQHLEESVCFDCVDPVDREWRLHAVQAMLSLRGVPSLL